MITPTRIESRKKTTSPITLKIEKPKLPESSQPSINQSIGTTGGFNLSKSLQTRIDQFVHGADELQREKIALFDLDDTLADYAGQLIYDLKRIASDGEPPLLKLFSTKPYLSARRKIITSQVGWWLNLPKFQLGWDVLEVVKELGYSVSVLSKGPKTNNTAWSEKLQWCNKHLAKDIDGVTICHDKSIIYGAVLVDDFPAYIKAWLNHRPRGLAIMPAQDYNADFIHPQVVRYDGTNILEVRMRLSERF